MVGSVSDWCQSSWLVMKFDSSRCSNHGPRLVVSKWTNNPAWNSPTQCKAILDVSGVVRLCSLHFPSATLDPNLPSNEKTYAVQSDYGRSSIPQPAVTRNNDDRPITPMRTTYRQIAAKFNTEDGLPMDPTLTNQYYEDACNDFEQDDDQSPTRERREREFHDQVCRSFNGTETSNKASRSQLTTINSMSRTIDPHHRPNPVRQSRYVASSRTIGSGRKHKGSSKSAKDDGRWRISRQNRSWLTAIVI